jgi:hypothetical protein
MFHTFTPIVKAVDSGDNSPNIMKKGAFRLSTPVENPVDNFRMALAAVFSTHIPDSWRDSNKLPRWMDCG